ncbi:substrate-binding domain-containing protein [Hyunsoonleella sp. SJ7]|uniref:Substrate-binding domain-containing protein n=1 Tax=Hyunsoonleella aquatilis TaxID=2762758 RepID=A0A923HFW6_9FLAO|nr:substrate-binding domain-containing protein [Hyunsoonleella aquatilis]MBC3758640.1 substrate-binding domain-containing protein [Hyunsoonleella aquatilis]
MPTKLIKLKNLSNNDSPKYIKIVNAFKESIETNALKKGESIPSINEFSKDYSVSRDTVYKAYVLLKKQGYIQATPNKGYYISQNTKKVLMLISTFKAYKEVFYHSFMGCLPDNVIVDLQFHHYNIKNFKSMLDVENGKYYKYIVMGFDHPDVESTLSKIDRHKLLLIDWKANLKLAENYVFQDFGKAFYSCLEDALHLFKNYEALCFIYPEYTHHPYESVSYFEKFCNSNRLEYSVSNNGSELVVKKNTAYICVNDRILYELLGQCADADLIVGKDVGILSYNDTPLKRFTKKGISVISVDFREFGNKVAQFITADVPLQTYLKTNLILRESL